MGAMNTKSHNVLRNFDYSCQDDLQCQNIDSKNSLPGKTPVLVCPEAKCVSGTCECGSKCKKDPYMGFCCKDVEERIVNGKNGEQEKTTFCIENFSNSTQCGKQGTVELYGPW
jgi:hypothetical protein